MASPIIPKSTSLKPVRTEQGKECTTIVGSFVPAGTNQTAPTGVRGDGFTVTQTATGVFLIALTRRYKETISFTHGIDLATAADATTQGGTETAPTSSAGATKVLRAMAGATPTNYSADGSARVHFNWTVRKF